MLNKQRKIFILQWLKWRDHAPPQWAWPRKNFAARFARHTGCPPFLKFLPTPLWCYTVADSDTELEVHIPVSQSDGAIPVKNDAHQPLDGNEALQLMRDAQTKHVARISTAPTVQPRGGTIFLYNLELDKLK